ncbi:DUF6541 family protein [Modestobacter sp. SYSU DS0875]
MSAWAPAVPHMVMALVLLFAPGTVVLVAGGAAPGRALLFAPGPSVGIVATTAVAAGLLGRDFGLPAVVVSTAAVAALTALTAWGVRWSTRRRADRPASAPSGPRTTSRPAPSPRALLLPGAVLLASLWLAYRLASALGGPDRVSQTFDAVFHLNTTRYVLDSGEGSSLRLAGWGTGDGGFYPAAWHDLAALVAFDGDVVSATQALGLVVAAAVWPVSMLTLVRQLVGPRPSAVLGVAVIIPSIGLFPARMLDFGVLYPFLLGISFMPAVVALVHMGLIPAGDGAGGRPAYALRGPALAAAAGLGAVGLVLAHPGVLLSCLLIVLPLLLARAGRTVRDGWSAGRRTLTALAVVVAVAVVTVAVLAVDRSSVLAAMRMSDWPARVTPSQAVGSWLTMSPLGRSIPWVAAGLAILGIGVAARRRGLRWLVVAHALSAVPFVFATSVDSELSQRLTGFWYNDSARLAVLIPVTALPLAAIALSWLADRVRPAATAALAARPGWPGHQGRLVAVGLLLLGCLGVSAADSSSADLYAGLAKKYDYPTDPLRGTLLTADEMALLERLPSTVPEGTRVASNPWDGSGLAYAVAGVPVLVPQLGARPAGQQAVVAEGLRNASTDPDVCRALADLDIGYALDFGAPLWRDGRFLSYPGLTGLTHSDAVRLVDHEGRARLYEVTACRDRP